MLLRRISRNTSYATLRTRPFNSLYPVRRYSDATITSRSATNATTKVEKILLDNIKATGPFSFATYMALCLSHPTDGYYTSPKNPVFGSKGDFITSPEISQVFGEMIGLWFLSTWASAVKQPGKLRLVELGPGRGTLMDDMLRVFSKFTGKSTLTSVHLVETSETMRQLQKLKLGPLAQQEGWELVWHNSIEEIEPSTEEYTMLVAHEFFDALPIHILQKSEHGWREVLIASENEGSRPGRAAIDSTGDAQEVLNPSDILASSLRRVLSSSSSVTASLLGNSSPRFAQIPPGSTLEVSPISFRTARKIGELIGSGSEGNDTGIGGSALIIDYGDEHAFADSFRSFKDHKIVDVFHRPGECDLTANVDFAYLKESVQDIACVHGPIKQGVFLERMGIQMRVDALKRASSSAERKRYIEQSADRLVDPLGMGGQYQMMALTSSGTSTVWPFVTVS